nr:hypothetical protein [Tanacetum cinerariifolium]
MTSITSLCEMDCQVVQKKLEEKQLKEERAAKAKYWKLPVCYDDDDDEERSDSLYDNIISGLPPFYAITPNEPVLSTEEPDNSLRMGDEHLDTIPATSEVMEIVIPKVGGIDNDILLTIKDDFLREKFLNVNLLISKIEALNANPTPSSDCKTKSPSTSLISSLEETNTFDNSLPEDFTKDVVEDISPTKEPQVLNALPTHPTLLLNMKFQPSSESLFAYVVWIFLPFLVYSVAPYYLLSLRDEDIIFDLGICNSYFSRPDISHRYGTVKKFNTHRSHLNKCPMLSHGQNNPPLDVLLFHFYPP